MLMASLNTVTQSGSQSETQSPQTAGTSNGNASNASSVQPGTTQDILTSAGGVPLGGSNVTTVDLAKTNATTVQTSGAQTTSTKQQASPVFLGFAGVLFIAAIFVFIAMNRSEKNTTI